MESVTMDHVEATLPTIRHSGAVRLAPGHFPAHFTGAGEKLSVTASDIKQRFALAIA
jgi:hypothetical protein